MDKRQNGSTPIGLLAGIVLLLAVSPPLAYGQVVSSKDITVRQIPLPVVSGHGRSERTHSYAEYRFLVRNRSATSKHRVTLSLPAHSYALGDNRIKELTRTVVVPSQSEAIVSLYQPSLDVYGNGVQVSVDGKSLKDQLHFDSSYHSSGYYYHGGSSAYKPCNILVSKDVRGDFRDRLENMAQSSSSSLYRSQISISSWSTNWLGYSRFDGVIVTEKDVRMMPPGVKSALRRYVYAGGVVAVEGVKQLPGFLLPNGGEAAESVQLGFGKAQVFSTNLYSNSDSKVIGEMSTPRVWQNDIDAEDANKALPVEENIQVPVKGVLALMVGFAVVVGPLNLWWLGRKNKRIWLLWNIPLISILTSGVVFGYSLISEGISGRVRSSFVTVLDENSHLATTIGWQGYYCPLTPSDGLHYETDTELNPLVASSYRASGSARAVDWTNDQHLKSGWVSARVPAHFRVRRSETRRERVTLNWNDPQGPSAVNGLGVKITDLYVQDREGLTWKASNIKAGEKAALKRWSGRTPRRKYDYRELFCTSWANAVKSVQSRPMNYLQPNTYIAQVEGSPFVSPGLENFKTHKAECVVIGICGRDNDGR